MAIVGKTPSDQVDEIQKLVDDARETLSQIVYAVRALQIRLKDEQPSGEPGA